MNRFLVLLILLLPFCADAGMDCRVIEFPDHDEVDCSGEDAGSKNPAQKNTPSQPAPAEPQPPQPQPDDEYPSPPEPPRQPPAPVEI